MNTHFFSQETTHSFSYVDTYTKKCGSNHSSVWLHLMAIIASYKEVHIFYPLDVDILTYLKFSE